jgi:hypothetical protein
MILPHVPLCDRTSLRLLTLFQVLCQPSGTSLSPWPISPFSL